jgi:hypothetical protein
MVDLRFFEMEKHLSICCFDTLVMLVSFPTTEHVG